MAAAVTTGRGVNDEEGVAFTLTTTLKNGGMPSSQTRRSAKVTVELLGVNAWKRQVLLPEAPTSQGWLGGAKEPSPTKARAFGSWTGSDH